MSNIVERKPLSISSREIEYSSGLPSGLSGTVPVLESKFAGFTRPQIIRVFWRAILVCCVAALCGLNDGYQTQLAGGIIANSGFIDRFGVINAAGVKAVDPTVVSLWGGLDSAAQTIGQFLAGMVLGDMIGRRNCLILWTIAAVIGSILELVAATWPVWLVAKIMFGFGQGGYQVSSVTYISEVAPVQVRGALLSLYSVAFGLGQLFGTIGLQVVETSSTPLKYKNALYSEWVFHGLVVFTIFFIPESPWYYARKHDHEKAKKALLYMHKNVPGYDIAYEYSVLSTEVARNDAEAKAQRAVPIAELFNKANIRRTAGASISMMLQQLCGVPIFFAYTTYFFAQSGVENPFLSSVIVFLLLNVFLLVSMYTTEMVGRRRILLYGSALMAIFNVVLGITGSINPVTAGAKKASLAVTCLWVVVYSLSAGPVGFAMAGELPSPKFRSKTTGVAIGSYGLLNILFQFTVPVMLDPLGANLGVKAGYIFGALTCIAYALIWWLVPETTGRTVAELDELYAEGLPARNFRSTVTTSEVSNAKAHQGAAHHSVPNTTSLSA